ncbi:MAG: DUF72 domain-containing protein [Gemmatimonadales bacterium]
MADIHLGTQRWYDRSWVGTFFPPGISKDETLRFYSKAFDTVELMPTFFQTPPDAVVAGWRAQVPSGFRFAPRVPQQITHELRFAAAGELLARFVSRVDGLANKLGPILIQLPPDLQATNELVERFRSFVSELSPEHGWAIEFRHESWLDGAILDTLRDHNVALAVTDGRWLPRAVMIELAARPTADFLYVRWHGSNARPFADRSKAQDERSDALSEWARVLWQVASQVSSIWGYFSDQFEGHAPHSARVFQRMMGLTPVDPAQFQVELEAK